MTMSARPDIGTAVLASADDLALQVDDGVEEG